ncbi:hypothetical protein [Planobispora rosea]|nr:hypothetical protein [Planobispora rosea]
MPDVLGPEDVLVQDFCIPTRRAFEWWYRLLDLRVENSTKDAS